MPRRVPVRERVESQQSEDLAAQLGAMRAEMEKMTEQMKMKAMEADAAITAAREEADRKAEEEPERIYKEVSEVYGGLSRANLLSDEWHAEHPEAAKHLFGLRAWHETRSYVWALFDVKRPVVAVGKRKRTDEISDFEKILITKMRIHRAYVPTGFVWSFVSSNIALTVRADTP